MGEIFIRPKAEKTLECTGERLTSALTGETVIEHWHRYMLARELARGLDVLDIASGEGYGSALMAQTARKVTGVEISVETVAHARASYVAANLSFLQGDARKIPLADASVDLVVSFETLEHFREHDQFLGEVKRVLRPDGALLLSTPDRDIYSPAGLPPNPHHILELTPAEFGALLGRHFAHVSSQGQRVLLGSALLAQEPHPSCPNLTFERRGAGHFETSVGMARPRFIVSMASDVALHRLPSSVYIDSDRLGYTDGPALEALPELRRDAERVETVEAELAKAKSELERANRRCEALKDACDRTEEAAQLYRSQAGLVQGLNDTLALMRASTSWKVSAPIRVLGRMLRRS